MAIGMGRRLAAAAMGLLLTAGTASAQPIPPPRKAGLWSVTITGGPMGGMHMETQSCADPAKEKAGSMFQSGGRSSDCSLVEAKPAPGGGWGFHSICKPAGAGMTVDTTGVATGDFQTGYVVKTTSRMTPPPMPEMAVTSMTMTARYLGACPADMKPGDAKVNGRVMHAPG